jgi:hypothetical protein
MVSELASVACRLKSISPEKRGFSMFNSKSFAALCGLAITFAAASPAALACDQYGRECGGQFYRVFAALNGHYCSSGRDQLNQNEAMQAAREIADGRMGEREFLAIYNKDCSSGKATEIAREVRWGRVDFRAYLERFGQYCSSGRDQINENEAVSIGRAVARGEVALQDFVGVYNKVCSTSTALDLTAQARRGQLSLAAFHENYGKYCSSGRDQLNLNEATAVAQAAAQPWFDLNGYGRVYARSCSSGFSLESAKESGRGQFSVGTFEQAYGKYCSSGRDQISQAEATDLARLEARHQIKMHVFWEAYANTCSVPLAKQIACGPQFGSLTPASDNALATSDDGAVLKSVTGLESVPAAFAPAKAGQSRVD